MRTPFFRRNEFFYSVGEKNNSGLIVVLNGGKSKHCAYLRDHIFLQLFLRSEIFRSAYIDKKHYSKFPFFFKYFYVRMIEPCGHIPINSADIIARLVFAHFT